MFVRPPFVLVRPPETFCSVRKPEQTKPDAKQKKTAADETKRGADETKNGGRANTTPPRAPWAGHLRKPIDGAGHLYQPIAIFWGG